ncbi:response regulator [Nocardioides marinquilinus]|uniref:histidine kinase n=1 Tax=Nocardioides marinquilinus TaxID=1210400 RepID=A0ABP9Q638_9ACTN
MDDDADLSRQIVGSLTDGIVTLAFDGRIRYANASAETLLGLGGLAGRNIHEFLDEQGAQQSAVYLARAAEGQFIDREVDTMLVRADGTPLWVRLRQTGLVVGGRITGVVLRLTDNDENKRLQEQISDSREQLLRAERIARSGSWSWDVVHGGTSHSAGLAELYGDRIDDLLSLDVGRIMAMTHPEDQERLTEAVAHLRDGSDHQADIEVRQLGQHGWMWVRLRAVGTYDADGRLVEVSGTYQDITRARDTADQLQDLVTQNSLMQAVATAANEAESLDELLLQARDLVVLHDDWHRARAFVPAPDRTRLVPHLDVEEDDPTAAAIEQTTADECFRRGEAVWDPLHRLTLAFPVRLDGRILAVVTITSLPPLWRHEMIQDLAAQAAELIGRVAEREEAGRLLADARDRALEASQAKSDFLATMSHEIRTPLNGIIGLNELLGATPLDDRQQHLVSGITISSRSLLDLINDILDFSKIEAGRLEVERVDFEVREVLAEVGNVLGESARTGGIDLQVSCSPDVPDVLSGDPTRLKQVLLNLGSNAVKFTTEGSVSIRATAVDDPSVEPLGSERMLRVEVRDTGVGIPADQREHIFAPFTQADTSTTRRFGGTGLGLAICAEIVAAFGGEIGVESEPGLGSTFWFTARLGAATGHDQDAVLARAREVLGDSRILVVDDNPQNRLILVEQLSWWDVEATSADGSEAAMAALARAGEQGRGFDAMLLDMAMPGRDGLSVAAAVRAAGYPPEVPIVMLTSSHTPADDALRDAGVTACLTKPVPSSTLRDVLLTLLDRDGPRDEPTVVHKPQAGARGRVLVVEDNHINQLVARGFLEAQGFAVETADDGLVALEMVRGGGAYDAVLMDVQMPRLDGYETTRALRRDEAGAADGVRLPIIAMTAGAVAGEREKCLAAGMDDFITKPVSPTVLAATLDLWVPEPAHPVVVLPESQPEPDPVPEPQPASAEGSGEHLDPARLEELLELGDAAIPYLERAIGNFVRRRPEVLAALHEAVDGGDPTRLSETAHSLKGSASNLGLPVVTRLAGALEELGRADTVDGAAPLLVDLESALTAGGDALEAYRASFDTAD